MSNETLTDKDGNPKDGVGGRKVGLSNVPLGVLLEMAVGMQEGALKYGRHNYRVKGVRGSVYFDATIRHMFAWFEGEDIDPDSGLSHITKAMCSLAVLRDAMIQNKLRDDRPPKGQNRLPLLNEEQARMVDLAINPVPPYIDATQTPEDFSC